MLTRIEISGFKSFQGFSVDFRPFQVFIGPNGVGKTNLFDAVTLLAALAGDQTVEQALCMGRGELSELFTLYPDGTRAKKISLAAEMLINRQIEIGAEKPRSLLSTRLRYEVELESRIEEGRDRVYVAHEALIPIKESDDKWAKENLSTKARKAYIVREKRPPYLETVSAEGVKPTIFRNQDAPGGGREGTMVGGIEKTILSGANPLRYPTLHAAREEMRHWRFLGLQPSAMRMPAPKDGSDLLSTDGSNLASVLSRLAQDSARLEQITTSLGGFIPTIKKIMLTPMIDRDEVLIEIESSDKQRFSSRVLSDGTLRLLALVSLRHDPIHRGALCFEEPENGVQPMRMRQIVDVLYALATDLEREQDLDPRPTLRQVIINTHSPNLLAHVPADAVYYMHMKPGDKGRSSQVVPVRPELIRDEEGRYLTWEQVGEYLAQIDQKRDELGL
ncbi:MAG: AAA family ATPase [Anaerolinea sp.]|nr:AAA family ATPase [Anaerolinea sp.]